MKYILAVALVFFIVYRINAQDKVEGMYKFKIGKSTTATIKEIVDEQNMKYAETSRNKDIILLNDRGKPKVFQLINSNTAAGTTKYDYDQIIQAPYSPACKAYFIESLRVGDLKIEKMYLYFFEDTLVKIECDQSPELEKAFTAKYGEPEKKNETKPIKCTYKFTGATFEEEEKTYYSEWFNDSIKATSCFFLYFDDHCQKQYGSYFIIEDVVRSKAYSNEDRYAENKIKKALDAKEASDQKGRLKDL